jgi:5-methylcytosine-specific restriction protein A
MRRALRTCAEPGCPALVRAGRCPQHERARRAEYESRPERRAEQALYHSAEWRAARAEVLRLNPWCVEHLAAGERVPASEVDHAQPVLEGGAPLDPANLVPRCKSCHSRKTMAEQRRRGEL